MKHVAKIEKCEQTSPDDWALSTYLLEVDENTTVGQILFWVKKVNPRTSDFKVVAVDEKPKSQPEAI